jgi:hypothetical protein
MNFLVAGMAANRTYIMRHAVVTGSQTTYGPLLQFTTGTPPSNLIFPSMTVTNPPNGSTDTQQGVLLTDQMGPLAFPPTDGYMPTAYNLKGEMIWYYPGRAGATQNSAYYIRPVNGGTILVHLNDPNSTWFTNQIWREIDLAGNTLKQTNATHVNEMINAAGYLGCTSFTHDGIRLPNGHTLILCTQERLYPAGTQGSTTQVDVAADGIVDLDENLQLKWYWSAYDHLDINRAAILGEKVTTANGFQPVLLSNVANDWIHGNSLNYIPSTGDILFSARDQDWLLKLNYKNGTGDGSVIWTLGQQGSFAIVSDDPYPWFTHQHDAEFDWTGTNILSVFDNGNTRLAQNPGITEEFFRLADRLGVDLGNFSQGGGSAQRLDNGNYHFDNSVLGTGANRYSWQQEIAPITGTIQGLVNFQLNDSTHSYRSYRMSSLYSLN